MSDELTFNISYSLLSKFNDHKSGALCGERFEQQYLRKKFDEPSSDAAEAGQWFEFRVCGTLPRSGKEPVPKCTKAGELTAMYKYLETQASINFPAVYQDTEITEKGKEIIFDYEGFTFKMILDVVSVSGFITQIRDIKSTGNFNEYQGGWAHTYKHPFWQNPHVLQAKIYIWSWWKQFNEIPEFYFDVFSSSNGEDFEVFEIRMNEMNLIQFEEQLLELAKELRGKAQIEGFQPMPEFKRCRECKEVTDKDGVSLFDSCKFKTLKVNPIIVNIP